MVIEFYVTKMNNRGDKLPPKYFYSNPLDYILCIFTEIGVYFSLLNSTWSYENQYTMFIKPRPIDVSASSHYTDGIKNWVTKFCDHIDNFIWPKHMNAYSNQKGGATHAYSGTTSLPLLSSIFHRGEWTLVVVLDIYWKFAEAGDHYLVRILAVLDPFSEKIGVLPTHFTVPSEKPLMQEGLNFCFGKIIEIETARTSDGNSFVVALLSRCISSFIFHSSKLRTILSTKPSRLFSNITIFKIQSYWNH